MRVKLLGGLRGLERVSEVFAIPAGLRLDLHSRGGFIGGSRPDRSRGTDQLGALCGVGSGDSSVIPVPDVWADCEARGGYRLEAPLARFWKTCRGGALIGDEASSDGVCVNPECWPRHLDLDCCIAGCGRVER